MKLGRFFSYEELVKLREHPVNKPDEAALISLVQLCLIGLDPIRDKFGPVLITSGYRNELYNASIGGAKNSQHLKGEAADFIVRGKRLIDVFHWIRKYHHYDQVIHEIRGDKEWIHYSCKMNGNRKVAMTALFNGHKMVYRTV